MATASMGLVVGDPAVPTAGDAVIRTILESAGFVVTYVDDAAAVPSGFAGFVITASTTAATVGVKYDAVALPVVTLQFDLWDDNRLSTNVGASTAASANYDLETHVVTTNLPDPLAVLTAALAQRGVLAGALAAGAATFARPGADATRAAAWTVETGGALTSGTAPARRAALFLPDTWPATLTTNGRLLVQRTFEWAFRTLTLTYEPTLSRVKIEATGLGGADTAQVERSLDQVTWVTVRGGEAVPVVNGVVTLHDYEFGANVVNYYRVTTALDVSFIGVGAVTHLDNANVTPALPAGFITGDLLVIHTASRNLAVGPGFPTGYVNVGFPGTNAALFGKLAAPGETAPTVTYAGGSAGDTTSAYVAAYRNATLTQVNAQVGSNPLQNIPYPALDVPYRHALVLYGGWKQDDWTSVATLAGDGDAAVEVADAPTTVGSDQGLVLDHVIQTGVTPVNVAAGSFVVTGGGAAVNRGAVTALKPGDLTQSASITPTIDAVWLKSIGKPFLNRSFTCVPRISDVEREARNGVFEVLGRSFPVAITDLRRSREVTIDLVTRTTQERVDLDFVLAAGDPMFVQTPPEHPLPTMHVVIGRTTEHRPLRNRTCQNDWRVFTLPLREVAAPGPGFVGSTVTWQSVINGYATWQDVINGETSWFDLLQNVGAPGDVIVP